jgi:EAL domain-containing protein (putative c-di-GMP-specific phosphodiesterase class I)
LEALVRWQHPTRGLVMPGYFIPIAERTGTIVQLGALIIDKVCRQIAQWKNENGLTLSVSINVSPRQLEEGGIDEIIGSAIRKYQIEPGEIEIELTESSMMSESADVMSQLAALRALGIDLHVDDFGTGYSSLSRIQRIDMQVIKIDRAFTSRLGTSPQANALVKTIVLMAQALDMSVIAEGVETVDQLRDLRDMHCDEVQGYLFSQPLPAADVPGFMQQWDFHAAVFGKPALTAISSS